MNPLHPMADPSLSYSERLRWIGKAVDLVSHALPNGIRSTDRQRRDNWDAFWHGCVVATQARPLETKENSNCG